MKKKEKIKKISFIAGILILIIIALILTYINFEKKEIAHFAIIKIEGPIIKDDFYFQKSTNPEEIIKAIEKAKNFDGILLYIDSPGGSAVSSFKIAQAIKNFKTNSKKPVIAYIDEKGLSGAYLIASTSDKIYASNLSLVGSIGVTASYLELAGLLERYNITYINLTKGKYKEIGNPLKRLSEEERKILEKKLELVYNAFIDEISNNRNITKEKVIEMATGEFFLAEEAIEKGLVDKIAYFDEVKLDIEKELNKSIKFIEITKKSSLSEQIKKIISVGFYSIGYGFGDSLKKDIKFIS